MKQFPREIAHFDALAVDSYAMAFKRKPEMDAFSGDFRDRWDEVDFNNLRTQRACRAGWPMYDIDLNHV